MNTKGAWWTVACQSPLSIGFSRQEYWSGLPFPSPGHLPDPGTEPMFLMSPALADGFFLPLAHPEKPKYKIILNVVHTAGRPPDH